MDSTIRPKLDLLVFNLATDEDDPLLGFAVGWLRALAKRARRVDVITMRKGRADLPANVQVFSVGKEKGHGELRRGVTFYWTLAGLLRRRQYDACFAHMAPLFAVMGSPLLRFSHVPIVLWYAHKATPTMLRAAARVSSSVVTSTAHGFRVPSPKVTVIGQGIDITTFARGDRRRTDGSLNVICVGRISPIKRLEVVVDAIGMLASRRTTGVRVELIGPVLDKDREYARSLSERARSLGIEESVRFVGVLKPAEIADRYRDADVALNPSRTGALDKAALEAMSCGVPVVTSNEAFAPLLRTLLPEIRVPSEGASDIADACERLFAMPPEELEALRTRLRDEVVRNHSLDHLVDGLLAVIRDVTGGRV